MKRKTTLPVWDLVASVIRHSRSTLLYGPPGTGKSHAARQPGPRFWLSDGLVTGISDRQSVDLVVDVTRICGKAAITRVDTVDDLCRHLKSGIKNGRTASEKA